MQPSAHMRVPDYWREMAATINADPESPAKSSCSPLDDYYQMPTKWGFFGVDSINLLINAGVVSPNQTATSGDVPG